MARVYTIDVVTSASQSPISRQRVEQANRVSGWPDGGFLLWLKRQLSACLFKPSQCQLCEILAILPLLFFFFFFPSSQCWWLAPYKPDKKNKPLSKTRHWMNIFFVRSIVYLPPKVQGFLKSWCRPILLQYLSKWENLLHLNVIWKEAFVRFW